MTIKTSMATNFVRKKMQKKICESFVVTLKWPVLSKMSNKIENCLFSLGSLCFIGLLQCVCTGVGAASQHWPGVMSEAIAGQW